MVIQAGETALAKGLLQFNTYNVVFKLKEADILTEEEKRNLLVMFILHSKQRIDMYDMLKKGSAPTENRTQGNCLEGNYVTTTPLARNWRIGESNP